MKRLFVDTGAFIAKEIVGDQYHRSAVRLWTEANDQAFHFVSSHHVLDEAATLLARRSTYAWAAEWGKDALDSGIQWLHADECELRQAFSFMEKYGDQGVSFTDCLSFVLMKRAGIKLVFGFDRHFEAAGFRLWKS